MLSLVAKEDVGSLSMQMMSTFLTVINYNDEMDIKYTLMGAALYGRGDILRLLNVNELSNTFGLGKNGQFYEIPLILKK